MKIALPSIACVLGSTIFSCCHGYTPSADAPSPASRRVLFQKSAAFVATAATAALAVPPARAAATNVDACPPRSNNCIRTTWTPPAGTGAAKAAQSVKDVLESYPQEGQAGVDLSGWTLVEDQFGSSSGGVSRIEFRSGIGNFAKFLNGGKPFVDDVLIQVDPDTAVVQVRSASRVGDSDLGVNQKRLQFFAQALTAKGWDAPEPKY